MAKTIIKALKSSLLLLLAMLPILSCCGGTIGIGVSPSEIFVADALRGGEFQRTIKIFNAMENATTFALNATGDVCRWVSFYIDEDLTTRVTNVTVAATSDQTVFVVFTVPSEASNGNYSGTIYAQSLPGEASGSTSTSVILSASVRTLIEVVGTQILTGEVQSISTMDTEVGYLLRIKVDFKNTGNVVAKPEVETLILKDGIIKDNFTDSKTSVKPGLRDIIPVEWNTTGKESGDYTANVTVSLGSNILTQKSLSFKILPVGTLTRKGELVALSYEGEPLVGIVLRIRATFRNTGLIDTQARFIGEVYKGDNLVEVIDSLETFVEVGAQKNLTSYFKLTEKGQYIIKGHVAYDGKQTDDKELTIQVKTTDDPAGISLPAIILTAMIIGIPIFLIDFIKKKKVRARARDKARRHDRFQ